MHDLPQALAGVAQPGTGSALDVSAMRKTSLGAWLAGLLQSRPLYWLMRCIWPIVRVGKYAAVFRFEDVAEVLTAESVFHVQEDRVRLLYAAGSPPGAPQESFVLGLQDGPEYQAYQQLVMKVFRLDDIASRVGEPAQAHTRALLDASREGNVDAIGELITAVTIQISEEYFGVAIRSADPSFSGPGVGMETEFARWMFVISTWLFFPLEKAPYQELALEAGARLNRLVADSIARAKQAPPESDTILSRLLALQKKGEVFNGAPLDDEKIRVILLGMMLGFVPTNTMAGGHIMEVLLERPAFLAEAHAAAVDGDDARLTRCLFEAMRFMALLREPLRICTSDTVLARGKRRAKSIKKGTRVIAITRSAMFDPRVVTRSRAFDPERPGHHSLVFGYGLHRCIGAKIAEAQITHTLGPLLQKQNLRRAAGDKGKLQRLGPFPERLHVQWDG